MRVSVKDYAIGDRVETHPATDAWMRGDRYGWVENKGWLYVHVRLDRSGTLGYFVPEDLIKVEGVSR